MLNFFFAATGIKRSSYQCPQQKKLKIPHSRFNDGICDCCDGSDEPDGVCKDNCDEVLAAERALQAKMAKEFSIGYEKRQKDIMAFQEKVTETKNSVQTVEVELKQASEKVNKVVQELDQYRHEYMQQRLKKVAEVAAKVANTSDNNNNDNNSITGLFEPMSDEEVTMFIIHACQIAGEMENAVNDDQTCIPLRLAGIDLALLWNKEDLDDSTTTTLTRMQPDVQEQGKLLSNIMLHNAEHTNMNEKMYWDEDSVDNRSRKNRNRNHRRHDRKRHNRRRLQEEDMEEEIGHGSSDEYYHDMAEEEDYDEERNTGSGSQDDEPRDPDMLETLKDSLFSRSRVSFVRRAQELQKSIDELLEENEKDGEDSSKDGEAETVQTEKKPIDPIAFNMVKSELSRREGAIQRGYDYAVSAQILLNALKDNSNNNEELYKKELRSLAVGTILFGNLSATHVWQILQAVLPEFNEVLRQQTDNDDKTCASSPWMASCPPQSIERSVGKGKTSFPPPPILQAAQLFCNQPLVTEEQAHACNADAENELPTSMPEGYHGYVSVKPRDDNDPFIKIAAEWDSPIEDKAKSAIEDLESKEESAREENKELERKLEDLKDLLEGAENSRYGIDGELFALKDTCHDVKAGKYTYEVCIFGSAQQKEGNAKSGTSLGQWNQAEFDEESGKRALKWDKGQKCWNGPQRSATVYVTCGAETKILSADEPDTCRYVLEMESYIACDDDFKQRHDL